MEKAENKDEAGGPEEDEDQLLEHEDDSFEGFEVSEEENDFLESGEALASPPIDYDGKCKDEETSGCNMDGLVNAYHRSISPSFSHSLVDEMKSTHLNDTKDASIQKCVTSEVNRHRAKQILKYHSKKSAKKVGRLRGSKAKQDVRVKLDTDWY